MFALFIAHHILNLNWYKMLFTGKYVPVQMLRLIVDITVFASMLMQVYSGITMSHHIFAFLSINIGMALDLQTSHDLALEYDTRNFEKCKRKRLSIEENDSAFVFFV